MGGQEGGWLGGWLRIGVEYEMRLLTEIVQWRVELVRPAVGYGRYQAHTNFSQDSISISVYCGHSREMNSSIFSSSSGELSLFGQRSGMIDPHSE